MRWALESIVEGAAVCMGLAVFSFVLTVGHYAGRAMSARWFGGSPADTADSKSTGDSDV